jgi:hypothetical protein
MTRSSVGLLALLACVLVDSSVKVRALPPAVTPLAAAKLQAAYGKLPVRFEENRGQFDARLRYVSQSNGATLALTDEGATIAMHGLALRLGLPDGRAVVPGASEKLVRGGRKVRPAGRESRVRGARVRSNARARDRPAGDALRDVRRKRERYG